MLENSLYYLPRATATTTTKMRKKRGATGFCGTFTLHKVCWVYSFALSINWVDDEKHFSAVRHYNGKVAGNFAGKNIVLTSVRIYIAISRDERLVKENYCFNMRIFLFFSFKLKFYWIFQLMRKKPSTLSNDNRLSSRFKVHASIVQTMCKSH